MRLQHTKKALVSVLLILAVVLLLLSCIEQEKAVRLEELHSLSGTALF
jgi:hypothetical protein